MKKIFYIVIIVALPVIVFFQYKDYTRFRPEAGYDFVVNKAIDVNYHNQQMVKEYFANAVEIGALARRFWYESEIDIKFPDESIQAQNAAALYNQLVARNSFIEAKLLKSAAYKGEGYSNKQVLDLENGIDPRTRQLIAQKAKYVGLTIGSRGSSVWNMQKQLVSKGYSLPLDGVFMLESDDALKQFQSDNEMYPSGIIDEDTFEALFLNP